MYAYPATMSLSPRQVECLQYAACGKTVWETSKIMGLSEHTIADLRRAACARLATNNLIFAVARAVKLGLIEVPTC